MRVHRQTRNAFQAFKDIISSYTKKEKSKAEYHRIQYRAIPRIGVQDNPLENLALRQKTNLRVFECDHTQAIRDDAMMMDVTALFPEPDKDKPGTINFAITTHYQTFKQKVVDKGYSNYTMPHLEAELKEYFEIHIEKLQMKSKVTDANATTEEAAKPETQEARMAHGQRRGG